MQFSFINKLKPGNEISEIKSSRFILPHNPEKFHVITLLHPNFISLPSTCKIFLPTIFIFVFSQLSFRWYRDFVVVFIRKLFEVKNIESYHKKQQRKKKNCVWYNWGWVTMMSQKEILLKINFLPKVTSMIAFFTFFSLQKVLSIAKVQFDVISAQNSIHNSENSFFYRLCFSKLALCSLNWREKF